MSRLKALPMQHNNISRIFSERDFFDLNADYQRNSDVWDLSKKQLFIDSLINEYDIPKLYFHAFSEKLHKVKKYEYAIIDGKQRLSTIWEFINGHFALADDFVYFADKTVNLKGLTYRELGEKYPRIRSRFDSTNLPIIEIICDDEDLIEDLFSRLNEAVPLNSAESRNAIGGPMAKIIREIADHVFFKQKVAFNNKRFQHREVAARLLFLEYSLQTENKIYDTKKTYLDRFVDIFKKSSSTTSLPSGDHIREAVNDNLTELLGIFTDKDKLLLRSQRIVIYYLLARELKCVGLFSALTRKKLELFDRLVSENKEIAERDISKANYDLLEYNKLSIQGTNDASSIKERVRILQEYVLK